MKETLRQAGYTYIMYDREHGHHILAHGASFSLEVWIANKNHASWGLKYKNTHLEFVRSLV